jgi:hypothetical protein
MAVKLTDLITQREAAEIRGVTQQSISDLVKRGKLTTVVIGRRKFLLRSEVERFKPSKGGRPTTKTKPAKTRRSRKKTPSRK